jgi:hypothetical protein
VKILLLPASVCTGKISDIFHDEIFNISLEEGNLLGRLYINKRESLFVKWNVCHYRI